MMLNLHWFDSFHAQTLGVSSLVTTETKMLVDRFLLIESIAYVQAMCHTTHCYLKGPQRKRFYDPSSHLTEMKTEASSMEVFAQGLHI